MNNNISWYNKGWALIPLILLLVIIDQSTKLFINLLFSYAIPYKINAIFNITLIYNKGAAFSFLANASGWQKYFLITISSIVSLVLFVWLIRLNIRANRLLAWSIAFILSGALGNLIDRVIYGYVIDFLDFHWQEYHWPVFNIADILIFIGISLMLLDSFTKKEPKKLTD